MEYFVFHTRKTTKRGIGIMAVLALLARLGFLHQPLPKHKSPLSNKPLQKLRRAMMILLHFIAPMDTRRFGLGQMKTTARAAPS